MTARSGGLFAGALTHEAGVGVLLEALDLYPGARIDVVGLGPEAARLQAHPRVRLLGRVPAKNEEVDLDALVGTGVKLYLVLDPPDEGGVQRNHIASITRTDSVPF